MEEKSGSWLLIFLVILSIWFWRDHNKLTKQAQELRDENYSLQDELSQYTDALDQANSNIEDAQSYAWSSYDDMGYALDNLETIEP